MTILIEVILQSILLSILFSIIFYVVVNSKKIKRELKLEEELKIRKKERKEREKIKESNLGYIDNLNNFFQNNHSGSCKYINCSYILVKQIKDNGYKVTTIGGNIFKGENIIIEWDIDRDRREKIEKLKNNIENKYNFK